MRLLTGLLSVVLLSLATMAGAETLNYTTYYHNDHLGSPVAATNERGGLLWRAHFRPYGERQENPDDAAFGSVGYTGHAQDGESGLVYAGARFMDPALGRFMAVDPAIIRYGDPRTFNRFAYANNNPYLYIDPNGEDSFLVLRLGATAAAAADLLTPDPTDAAALVKLGVYGAALAGAAIGGGVTWGIDHVFNENSSDEKSSDENNGDKDASTPTGRRGSPLDVKPGTNEPTTIRDREYTGHALDRMQGRGVPPSAVEDAVENGVVTPGNRAGTTRHDGSNGVTVVTGTGGRVITVIPK